MYGGLVYRLGGLGGHPEIVVNEPIRYPSGEYEDNFVFYQDIYEDTVGQFTGLRDRNGKEIYEGDIVLQRGYYGIEPMVVKFEHGAFIVGWHDGSSTIRRPMLIQNKSEVIGNVIDNPELPGKEARDEQE